MENRLLIHHYKEKQTLMQTNYQWHVFFFSSVDHAPFPHPGNANASQKSHFHCKNENEMDLERAFSELTPDRSRNGWNAVKRGSQGIFEFERF